MSTAAAGVSVVAGVEARLGLGEQAAHAVDVPGLFLQSFVIPFAARFFRREEIAAVDVQRARSITGHRNPRAG
jgi:hypothetical protein